MPQPKHKKSVPVGRILLIGGLVILIAGIVLFALEKAHVTNFYGKPVEGAESAKTTSTATTAQSDFTGGDVRNDSSSSKNEGVATDNNGQITSVPSKDNWSTSASGNITLYEPSSNSLFTDGSVVSGASTLPVVSYRLIDDVSGMIANGTLKVVGGHFSGMIQFSSNGSQGRLDIFSATDDGVESDSIELPIRFK